MKNHPKNQKGKKSSGARKPRKNKAQSPHPARDHRGLGGPRPGSGRPRLSDGDLADLHVYVPVELLESFDRVCQRDGLSRSEALRQAMREFVRLKGGKKSA